jgi:peptidoglycan hydrolase-like protein with peptidoglycan-binding domain
VTSRSLVSAALLAALACAGRKGPPPEKVSTGAKEESPDSPAEKGVPPRGERPRVPASPEALLAPGAIGELQSALADRGYLKRHTPGELDAPTSAAFRRFQEDEGLAATGMPDRETLRRLGVSPTQAYGREGR